MAPATHRLDQSSATYGRSVTASAPVPGRLPEAPIPPNSLRPIRVLQILTERTDDERSITSTEIVRELVDPRDPAIPPVSSTRSTVRQAVACLRALGFDVQANKHHGYALATREFTPEEIDLLVRAVMGSPALTNVQRQTLVTHLTRLAGPTQRQRLESHGPLSPRRRGDKERDTVAFSLDDAHETIRLAMAEQGTISYELRDGAGSRLSRRCHLTPTELQMSDGTWFVSGTTAGAGESPGRRTFRVDRLANVTFTSSSGRTTVALSTTPDSADGAQD